MLIKHKIFAFWADYLQGKKERFHNLLSKADQEPNKTWSFHRDSQF